PKGGLGLVTYEWKLVGKPEASQLSESQFFQSDEEFFYSDMSANADVDGEYIFEVTARDGSGKVESASIKVVKSGL
ncbi:MAG: hypothetical protein ACWA5R_15140, partial [bacterium]